jgi:protein-disulfide isomerase
MIQKGAAELSLDDSAVRECILSGRYLDKIHEDIAAGDKAGLTATPSLWINGKQVQRPNPATLEKIFDSILTKQ